VRRDQIAPLPLASEKAVNRKRVCACRVELSRGEAIFERTP
jgi:hypothetical protein